MQAAYEHNGRPLTREAFYAIACDPARSVAVEACAGAGKTWMLVSRMLRALLDGCAPHEILAITFTKKAAGEMRQRLQEWLQGRRMPLPKYSLADTRGEAHQQEFEVECEIAGLGLKTRGVGVSRRAAEQQSAQRALELLPKS